MGSPTRTRWRTDNRELWGVDGLCGVDLGVVELHQQHPSIKVLSEEIRSAPGEVTVIAGGPLSNLAAAFQIESDLPMLIGHLIIVGGTLDGPGDVTAAAEFNVYCDAESARRSSTPRRPRRSCPTTSPVGRR